MNDTIAFFNPASIYTYFTPEQVLTFLANGYNSIIQAPELDAACKLPGAEVYVCFHVGDIYMKEIPAPFSVLDQPELVLFLAGALGDEKLNVKQIAFYNRTLRTDKQARLAVSKLMPSLTDSKRLFDFHN